MKWKLILILGIISFVFFGSFVYAILVVGTNAGLLTEAPISDPEGSEDPNQVNDHLRALKVVIPVGVTKISEIGWWSNTASDEANFEVGIYSHNAGTDEPGDLLEVSRTNAKGTDIGWKKATGLDMTVSSETTYWIAFQLDDVSLTRTDYSSSEGARFARQMDDSWITLPSEWGASDSLVDDWITGIYAVYETSEDTILKHFFLGDSNFKLADGRFILS